MTSLDPIQNGKFASSTTTSLQQNRRKQAICCTCPSSLLALLLTIVAVSPSFSPSVTPPVVQAAIPQFFSSRRRTLHNAEQQQQQQQSTNSSHSTVLPQQQRNAYPRRQPRQRQHHPFGFHATLREEQQIAQQPAEQPATPHKRAEGGAVAPQSQPQMVNRWRIASSAVATTNDPQQKKLKPAALQHRQRPPPPPQSVSMDLWTMVKSLWTRRKEKQKRQQQIQRIAPTSVQKEDTHLASGPKPPKTPPPLPSKGEMGRGEAQAQLKPPAESSTDIDPTSSVAMASSKQTEEDEGGATRKEEESQPQQQNTGVFSTDFGRPPPLSHPKLSVDQDTRANELDAISATSSTTTVSASSAEFANHVNVDTDAEETNGVEDDSTKDNDTNKHAPPQQRFAFWRNNGKPPTSKGTKDDDATTTTDADTLTKDSLQTATTPQTATDLEALKDEDDVVNARDDSVPLENAADFPSEIVANETTTTTTDVSSMMDSVAEAVFQEEIEKVQATLAKEDETRDKRNEWAQTSEAQLAETEIDEGQFEFRQRMEALADRLAEAQQPQMSEETVGEEGVNRKDASGKDVEIEDDDEEEETLPSDYNEEEAEELDNVESLPPTPQIDEDNEIIDLDVLDELEAQHQREIDAAARQEIEADLIDSTEAVLEDEYDETITDDEYEYDDEDDDVLLEADDQELTLDDWFGPPIFSARPGRRKRWTVHKNGLAASHPSIASAIFWVAQRYDEQFLARISEQLIELQHQQEEERNELLAQALAAREQHQLAKAERKQALRLRRRPIPMLAKMNVSEIEDGPDLTDEEFELLLQQLENEPIFEPISDYTDDEDTDEFDEALEMELESLQNPLQAFQLPQVSMKDSFMFQNSQVVSGLQLLDLTDHFDDSDEQLLLESEEQHQPGGRPRGDERLNEGDVWILVESNEYSELLDNTAEG